MRKLILALGILLIATLASANSWGGYYSGDGYNLGVYYNDNQYHYSSNYAYPAYPTYYSPYNYSSYAVYNYPYKYGCYYPYCPQVYGTNSGSTYSGYTSYEPSSSYGSNYVQAEVMPDDTRKPYQLGYDNYGTAFSKGKYVEKGMAGKGAFDADVAEVSSYYGNNEWQDYYN